MERLSIEPLTDFAEVQSFECGIKAMDEFIHDGLYHSVQIAEIDKMAHRQQLAGCQFLTVGAYVSKEYNAVGFYSKCGFAKAEPVAVRDTLRMYYNLLN